VQTRLVYGANLVSETNSKKVLVTGGAGFIGSHLIEGLLQRGYNVRVLDNFSTGKRQNLIGLGNGKSCAGTDFELIEGDIRDRETVCKAMDGMGSVLHQAALGSVPRSVADPVTTHQVNVDGMLNVLLAARDFHAQRVVYASSSSVYGDSTHLPKREGEEGLPLSPYALSKQINESYGNLFMQLYGLETIGLRYFNVCGPRQDPQSEYAAVIPRFISALLSGQAPVVYGTGHQSRDFTYVKDVVRANIYALEAPANICGSAYNIGRGDKTSLIELLQTLQEILNTKIEPRFEPPRPGDVMHSTADVTLTSGTLGFQAQHDLRNGLEQSIDWYRKNL
jgi:UDP-N-acetylglucosamine/UDP-N-acetylgalactosamine 4-epimerase